MVFQNNTYELYWPFTVQIEIHIGLYILLNPLNLKPAKLKQKFYIFKHCVQAIVVCIRGFMMYMSRRVLWVTSVSLFGIYLYS